MAKKKKVIIIAFILAILLIVGSALFYLFYEKPYVFKITIHPTFGWEECYYFILYEDSTLYCAKGIRQSNDINDMRTKLFYDIIEKSSDTKLTNQQVEALKQLVDEIKSNGNDYPVERILGDWNIALYYNKTIYETDYVNVTNEKLDKLMDEIIALSTIEVRTYGFS